MLYGRAGNERCIHVGVTKCAIRLALPCKFIARIELSVFSCGVCALPSLLTLRHFGMDSISGSRLTTASSGSVSSLSRVDL